MHRKAPIPTLDSCVLLPGFVRICCLQLWMWVNAPHYIVNSMLASAPVPTSDTTAFFCEDLLSSAMGTCQWPLKERTQVVEQVVQQCLSAVCILSGWYQCSCPQPWGQTLRKPHYCDHYCIIVSIDCALSVKLLSRVHYKNAHAKLNYLCTF